MRAVSRKTSRQNDLLSLSFSISHHSGSKILIVRFIISGTREKIGEFVHLDREHCDMASLHVNLLCPYALGQSNRLAMIREKLQMIICVNTGLFSGSHWITSLDEKRQGMTAHAPALV